MKKLSVRVFSAILSALLLCASLPITAIAATDKDAPIPVAAAPVKEPPNPFAPNFKYDFYFDYTSTRIYGWLRPDEILKAINGLPKVEKIKNPSKEKPTVNLLAIDYNDNYKKHQYELRKGELRYDGTAYKLTNSQYENLLSIVNKSKLEKHYYPSWLIWMNPNRVTDSKFTNAKGVTLDLNKMIFDVANEHRHITVNSKSSKTYHKKDFDIRKLKGSCRTDMTFDSGIKYTVALTQKMLYVESSDKSYGCSYELAGDDYFEIYVSRMTRFSKGEEAYNIGTPNPATGKPVIYLYPEKEQDISVNLNFKGEICYTYPEYNGGWNVTAKPDGTLNNKADGKTYYYLFWDGNSSFTGWDMSTGFCVKGSEVQHFFEEKLPQMGLTPREYNDFITYWVPLLAPNKYNLISFSTEQYEKVAKLDIAPKPDSILRVHMLYKALESPINIDEQILAKPQKREGFTVVEWGATRVS